MEPETVTISVASAKVLYDILGQTTLAVGSPEFAASAIAIASAKNELESVLSPTTL